MGELRGLSIKPITLETYVHWWPKKDRHRNIISGALRDASAKRKRGPKAPDLADLCRICARRSCVSGVSTRSNGRCWWS